MKRKVSIWKLLLATLSLLIVYTSFPNKAEAEPPYDTFSVDNFGRTIFTQPAYEPEGVVARDIYVENEQGESIYSPLSQPQDLFIATNDDIYIADTGNNRIVHLDSEGNLIKTLTVEESPLDQPSGVYVTNNGDIYIADTGNRRVIQVDSKGNLIQEFLRPESSYINESFVYEPINMVVDRRGFVYVVSRGTYQGIIQFEPNGDFYGFYGTNITEVGMMDRIRQIFYTEEQLARQVRLLPSAIRNIDIDSDGYVYTVSRSDLEQVKKLNIRGENQWEEFNFNDEIDLRFAREDSSSNEESESQNKSQLTDVTVDENGVVTVVDKSSAVVAQYNQAGDLLFFWTGPQTSTPQIGLNQSPAAIDTNSEDKIYILDDALNFIQVLQPTEFGASVKQAFILTEQGDYLESEQYWNDIVRQNALFTPAYAGLARAAFYREDYEEARELYKLAGDEQGYSDAFWQIRLQWFQNNFSHVANLFVVLGVVTIAGSSLRNRRKEKKITFKWGKRVAEKLNSFQLIQQLKQAFYILRHPIDGFIDLRFANKGSYLSAFIILALVMAMVVIRVYFTSFTFQPVPISSINVPSIFTVSAVVWVSWVICHYLIGAIKHGEARFKDVFIGSAYALFPVFLLGLPLAFLSNIMTLNEISIYGFFNSLMIIWSAALFFWKVQALQNYSVGETIISILLTVFSMIMLWVLIFIIVGLSTETIDFMYTLIQEVTM